MEEEEMTGQGTLIQISGDPVVQQRPRQGKYGNFYDPTHKARTELAYKLLVARQQAKLAILGGDLLVRVCFYHAAHGNRRVDLDNLLKAFFDSATGIFWHDDSQIVRVIATKRRSVEPKTVFMVLPYTVAEQPA